MKAVNQCVKLTKKSPFDKQDERFLNILNQFVTEMGRCHIEYLSDYTTIAKLYKRKDNEKGTENQYLDKLCEVMEAIDKF